MKQQHFEVEFKHAWRLTNIYRWHMCSKTREQTVAEHCANVQLICMELMKNLGWMWELQMEILHCALMHDMDEVIFGDSTPQMKNHASYDPPGVEVAGWPSVSDNPTVLAVVDLADKIEAFKFLREYGTGDYAREILGLLLHEVRLKAEFLCSGDRMGGEFTDEIWEAIRRIINTSRDTVI